VTAYYNEIDPHAAEWLRNLIMLDLIADGFVDERSIVDVQPEDLKEFTQCHFFAGIGGWSYAARLAGWPDDRPLWTGSCPCQPFSVAGKGEAQEDKRHLWPEFARLIGELTPSVVVGEQVAAAIGKDWLDGVFSDLERLGYACGAAVIPACAVNAPHRRDRLWFVADREELQCYSRENYERSLRQEVYQFPEFRDCNSPAIRTRDYWSIRQPGFLTVSDGVPGRVGQLRAYGNAIVPQVAAEVIAAYMECRP
jgi:DNA (cytosine-5)-methyltransferase 1